MFNKYANVYQISQCFNNYLPLYKNDYPLSCTSSGHILHLCKVTSVHQYIWTERHKDRQGDSYIASPLLCFQWMEGEAEGGWYIYRVFVVTKVNILCTRTN